MKAHWTPVDTCMIKDEIVEEEEEVGAVIAAAVNAAAMIVESRGCRKRPRYEQ